MTMRTVKAIWHHSCLHSDPNWSDCGDRGSPRMQGAAWGALAMLAAVDVERLGVTLGGWYDGASTSEGRNYLRSRVSGLMVPLLPLVIASDPDWLTGLNSEWPLRRTMNSCRRLPALRGGFQSLTPADRARLLIDRLAALEPRRACGSGRASDRRSGNVGQRDGSGPSGSSGNCSTPPRLHDPRTHKPRRPREPFLSANRRAKSRWPTGGD